MVSIRKMNIKNKLMAIIMLVSLTAVMLAGTIFIGFSVHTHKKYLAEELSGLAEVIGNNCKVILEFNIPEDAEKVLSTLETKKSIIFARIYHSDGNIYASYGKPIASGIIAPSDAHESYFLFENNCLHIFHVVRVNDRDIGTVYLQDDMRSINTRIIRDVMALMTIMVFVLITAYFISSGLQKMISGPILSLSEITKTVSREKNYTLRAHKESDDEVGQLIESFNGMLDQIQNRDKALRESEERFKLALKGADLGMWDWNVVTGHVIFSKRWAEMLGYTVEEIEPTVEGWKKMLHPDDVSQVMDILEDNLSGKTRFYKTEFRLKKKTGGWKWIQARGMIFGRDESGKPLRSVGTHLDTTERRLAEEARKERDEKIRAILAAVPDLMIVLDASGRYMEIFTGSQDLLSKPIEEVIGLTIHEVLPIEIAGKIQSVVDKTISTGESQYYEYELNTDNSKKWFAARVVPFKYQNVESVLWSARDITGLKKAELERQVMESQLQQAQKMESIGTLAGGIAHDFNNILSIIIGNIELAMDSVPEWNPALKNMEESKIAGLRAKDLIQQLLSFSRKTVQKRMPINISPIIKDSLKFLRSTIPANVEIQTEISDEPATVLADPTQIHQVMMNLCTNAAHAMHENGGVMKVGLAVTETGKDIPIQLGDLKEGAYYAKLTVGDTGYGVAKEHLDRIFDPYFTTKDFGEGSGVGLSVVHGIVKNHDGVIWVESEKEIGTTFTIVFPLVDVSPAIEEKIEDVIPKGKERILLVDDEPAIVNLVSQILEGLGYEVSTSVSSMGALEMVRSSIEDFDLVISDMSMPKMTGDRLAEEILKIKPEMPIILCTGFSQRMNEQKAREMGVRALIMKPIVKRVLAQTIRDVFDGDGDMLNINSYDI